MNKSVMTTIAVTAACLLASASAILLPAALAHGEEGVSSEAQAQAQQAAVCAAEGGCALFSRTRFEAQVQKAYEAGLEKGRRSCQGMV